MSYAMIRTALLRPVCRLGSMAVMVLALLLIWPVAAKAANGTLQENISYGPGARQILDVYQPSPSIQKPNVIVFFYGGNWQSGDKRDYKFVGETLASHGIVTVIPNYHLFPESPFPTFMNDAALALKWSHDHASDYGANPSSLFLMGHGSGASMTLLLALDPKYLADISFSASNIRGIICIGGFYGNDLLQQPGLSDIMANIHDPDLLLPTRFIDARTPPLLIVASRDEDLSDGADIAHLKRLILQYGGSVKIVSYMDLGRIGIMLPFSPLFHTRSTVVQDILDFITDPPAQH